MDSVYQIEDYLIDTSNLLGQGACGRVFACTKKNSNLQLCAKIITSFSQNVVKELDILNFMKDKQNENIVNVFLATRVPDQNYTVIIMEKCESDLEKEMKLRKSQGRKYTEQEALEIMKQLFNGYKILYQYQIIHRDIKPANILTQNGKYKIADFGVGKIYGADQNLLHVTKSGTPVFKAPELQGNYEWLEKDLQYLGGQQQFQNFNPAQSGGFGNQFQKPFVKPFSPEEKLKIHHKMDMYSFGILYFNLLTDSYPFELNMSSIANFIQNLKTQPFKVHPNYQISFQASTLIERMITYSPIDRIGFPEISQIFGFRLGTQFNKNEFIAPVPRFTTITPSSSFQKIIIVPPQKSLQDWINNLRCLFIEKCNENPSVMRAYKLYCDLCLQLASLVLDSNQKKEAIQDYIDKFLKGNLKDGDIKITMDATLDKYYYIQEFTNIMKSQFVPHIFNYEGARTYGEAHLKFMFYYFKLVNDHYGLKNLSVNPSIVYSSFKENYTKDTAMTKEQYKNFLDNNY